MKESGNSRRTVCLLAADISGDQNAARLAEAIRAASPGVRLVGAGGEAMRKAGVELAVETTDLSFVGLFTGMPFLPRLLARYRRIQRLVEETAPDLVVLIDSESVAVPFARWLHRRRVPAAFFFPPQVWFWGRWRLRGIVPLARKFLSAFREEAEIFSEAGADAVWVGHPLRDAIAGRDRAGDDCLTEIGLDPSRPLVALMPGSRRSEIRRLSGPILGAARILRERNPALQFAIPLATESLRSDLERRVAASGVDAVVYRPRSYDVLGRARVVIQSSGTATLETALLGIPSVIAYRCIPFEYWVGRTLVIRTPWIGMVNILLGEMVQPEFFHRNADADHLAAEAWSLLVDEKRRSEIRSRLAALPDLLGAPGVLRRAADELLSLLPATATAEEPAEADAGPEPLRATAAS